MKFAKVVVGLLVEAGALSSVLIAAMSLFGITQTWRLLAWTSAPGLFADATTAGADGRSRRLSEQVYTESGFNRCGQKREMRKAVQGARIRPNTVTKSDVASNSIVEARFRTVRNAKNKTPKPVAPNNGKPKSPSTPPR